MRLIFNHLLLRILDLAIERIVLLEQQKDNIYKWTRADSDEKTKHVKRAEFVIDSLLRNKDYIQGVLQALEESKPTQLSAEQDVMVSSLRKVFRWGLAEYKSIVEYASEKGFDKHVIEGLQRDQRVPTGPQKQIPQGEEEEE
jgi:hypothetical protein